MTELSFIFVQRFSCRSSLSKDLSYKRDCVAKVLTSNVFTPQTSSQTARYFCGACPGDLAGVTFVGLVDVPWFTLGALPFGESARGVPGAASLIAVPA